MARRKTNETQRHARRVNGRRAHDAVGELPIGAGVLDRDFDDIEEAEFDVKGQYGGSEDQD